MTKPIAEILTDLEQALKESTQGVWVQHKDYGWIYVDGKEIVNCPTYCDADMEQAGKDAKFIALTHTHLPSVLAELKRATESEDHLLFILRQIVISLPARLDWLDPNVERMAKEALEPAVGSCIHCSYLLGKVYKACDEHQVKETK